MKDRHDTKVHMVPIEQITGGVRPVPRGTPLPASSGAGAGTRDITDRMKLTQDLQRLEERASLSRLSGFEREREEARRAAQERIDAATQVLQNQNPLLPNVEEVARAGVAIALAHSDLANQIADIDERAAQDAADRIEREKQAEQDKADFLLDLDEQVARSRGDTAKEASIEAEKYLRQQEREFKRLKLAGKELEQARKEAKEVADKMEEDGKKKKEQDLKPMARSWGTTGQDWAAGGIPFFQPRPDMLAGVRNGLHPLGKGQGDTKQHSLTAEQLKVLNKVEKVLLNIAQKIGAPPMFT